MESLQVHLFKHSFSPFLDLLNENDVPYQMKSTRSGEIMACSEILEILKSDGFWQALGGVIVAFLARRNSRKVIITTKDNQIIHAENITQRELEAILKETKSIAVIETNKEGS